MQLRFSAFPRTQTPPAFIAQAMEVFERHSGEIGTVQLDKGLTSHQALAVLRADLVGRGCDVEASKRENDKIKRPVRARIGPLRHGAPGSRRGSGNGGPQRVHGNARPLRRAPEAGLGRSRTAFRKRLPGLFRKKLDNDRIPQRVPALELRVVGNSHRRRRRELAAGDRVSGLRRETDK